MYIGKKVMDLLFVDFALGSVSKVSFGMWVKEAFLPDNILVPWNINCISTIAPPNLPDAVK